MANVRMGQPQSYRPDIDGLRAIAVTSVVLFHAGVTFLSGGYVGVDVFFVLSGYLITGHIYGEVTAGKFTYKSFYTRRFKRILPALLVVLLISTALAVLILSPAELVRYSISAASAVFGVSNVYFWYSTNYFSPSADHLPMLMTWSLAVEEQFYVVFPIVLLLLFKYAKKILLPAIIGISVISLLAAVISIRLYPALTFYMLPMRAWELGAGAILAIAEARGFTMQRNGRAVREATGALGAALILTPIFLYSTSTVFPGEAALPPVLGTVLIIAARQSLTNSVLSISPATFIGKISYSWYLWHWPLLAFARVSTPEAVPERVLLAIVLISFLLAVLSFYFVERPFRQTTLTASRVLTWYGAAAVAVAVLVAAPAMFRGLPSRVEPAINEMEASIGTREPCLAPYGTSKPNVSTLCAPSSTRPAIALIGDSHAAALAPGLRTVAERAGLDVVVMTKSSCPPMVTVTRYMPNHPRHDDECTRFNKAVFDFIAAKPEIRSVVIAGYWAAPLIEANVGSRYVDSDRPDVQAPSETNPPVLRQGLSDELDRMSRLGRRILLLQDAPLFDKDPVSIALRDALPVRSFVADFAGSQDGEDFDLPSSSRFAGELSSARSVVNEVAGARDTSIVLVDPYQTFCTGGRCQHRSDAGVLYVDNQHLSLAGSSLLSEEILKGIGSERAGLGR